MIRTGVGYQIAVVATVCAITAAPFTSELRAQSPNLLVPLALPRPDTASIDIENGTYYAKVSVSYINLQDALNSRFWTFLREIFGTSDKEIMLYGTALTGSDMDTIEASRTIAFLKPNGSEVISKNSVGLVILPPTRVHLAESLKLAFKFREADVPRNSRIFEVLNAVDGIPIVNAATQGTLKLAASVVDSVTKAILPGQSSDRTIEATLSAKELVASGHVAIMAQSDVVAFNTLRSQGKIPASGFELRRDTTLPTYVLVKLDLAKSLFDFDTILSHSYIAAPTREYVNRISSARGQPQAQIQECEKLRIFARDALRLTSDDQIKLVMRVLKDAGYDPSGNSYHVQSNNCFDENDYDYMRRTYKIQFGSCLNDYCQAAADIAHAWLRRQGGRFKATTFDYVNNLGVGPGAGNGVSPSDFLAVFSSADGRYNRRRMEGDGEVSFEMLLKVHGVDQTAPAKVRLLFTRMSNEISLDKIFLDKPPAP